MGTFNVVDRILIKKSGVFDLDKLYKFVYAWLDERKYFYHEKAYKQKGVEMELEVEGKKKISGYTQFIIGLEFQLWDMKDVEVIKHGKKVKMTKTRIEVRLSGSVETDYEGNWKESKFKEALNNFYEKYIIKKTLEDEWMFELYKEAYDLQEKIKKIMEQEASRNG